ncbi:MAG: HyaD/HybD family hydrogenase maturation endopeptidase [Proteobacteria bacterium]|nr:HyaD/HybD family hydrogenase maturation endopeptidase [Pseudomonadota bacterium]
MRDALVLGIGNVLWGDEGFGVRCVEAFGAAYDLPPGAGWMDGGTQGLYLLPYVQDARRLLIFDAIDFGLAPGTLRVLEGADVPCYLGARKTSLHQTGFQEVLACAALTEQMPEALVLVGVQPEDMFDYGGSLRPVVSAQIPRALELAVERLTAWGVVPVRREAPAASRSPISRERYETGRPSAAAACRIGDARFLPHAD